MRHTHRRSHPLKKLILALSAVLLVLCILAAFVPDLFAPQPVEGTVEYTIQKYAKEHGYSWQDYPESLIDLLKRNPETEEFVLQYPAKKDSALSVDISKYLEQDSVPLFMQWDTQWGYLTYGSDVAGLTACGPTCLSMVAVYLTGDPAYSPDAMIRFATEEGYYVPGSGSSWTLISQGGPKLGLSVTELPLVEGKILKSLAAGHPVICAMGPGDFTNSGHFIVITGTQDGLLQINDPNSYQNSKKLWEYEQIKGQIRNLWSIAPGE